MEQIRAFIAIQLPKSVKAELGEVSRRLASQVTPRSVRWVKSDRLHLTLRFLGDTSLSRLPDIYAGLDHVAAGHPRFDCHLDRLGFFPNRRRPRVVWVGVRWEKDRLESLHSGIEELLFSLGFQKERRPFRAHLTLGRVKDMRALKGIELSGNMENLAVPVNAIHLIESELRPRGPFYTVRHSSRLAEEASKES
jgi:2'-5' RNA ligase